ncbi:hypothetical protein ACS0TY_033012 [Phlomoides rotata]
MRRLYPNLDREDGLDTVLEVPIPEEAASDRHKSWSNVRRWMTRPHSAAEIQFLLGIIGAPLIPLPIRCDYTAKNIIKGSPIESSMAKYIVQQYIAAAGGEDALNSIESMCAVGKVKMGEEMKKGEMGGFVLWQKCPGLWSLELMVSGYKMCAGSDGKVAWRQTPWQQQHSPSPLRRSLQGLDPRSTANLFSNSICISEKTINGEDCFVLKLEAEASTLRARSSSNVEIIRHTVWGCFSQRTGLLLQLEDSHLLKIKAPQNDDVLWETTIQSLIQDYRTVEGVNVAHAGRTSVSLLRFGENSQTHTRTRMEEIWNIEEVDFNIKGLSTDCFLPPADLKRGDEGCDVITTKNGGFSSKILANSSRIVGGKSATKVVAIDIEESVEMFHNGVEM